MSWIHDDEQIKDWEKSIQFKLVHKRRKDKIHNIRKALNLSKKENNEPPVCRLCIRKFNTPYELSHHIKCNHPNYKKVEEPPVTTSSLLDTFGSKREAASSYYSEAATSNFSLSVPEPRFQISGPDISDAETHDNSSENPPILEPTASNLEPLGQRRRNESKDGSHTSELNENEHYPHPAPRHSFREPSTRYSSRVSSYHSSSNDQYHNVHIKISPADPYSVGSPDDNKEIMMDEINYGGTSTEEDDPEPEELYTKNEKVDPIHINTTTTGKKAYLDLPKITIPSPEEYENIIIEERLEIPDVARLRASIPHGEDFSDEFTCN